MSSNNVKSQKGRLIRAHGQEAPEKYAARRKAIIERMFQRKESNETPEQAEERRLNKLEQAAERRALRADKIRKKLATKTLEQKSTGLFKVTKCERQLRQIQQLRLLGNREKPLGQQDADDSSHAQDALQDNSGDFESSDNDDGPERKRSRTDIDDTALKDVLHCMEILLEANAKRDDHSVYAEHIAHKIRTCKRDNFEINIAQHHIENVIFNLSMGVYHRGANADDTTNCENRTNEPKTLDISPASSSFQDTIIPKTEPDT